METYSMAFLVFIEKLENSKIGKFHFLILIQNPIFQSFNFVIFQSTP
ncbi:hypothetical protein SAMN03080617_00503 [Algoriphagus alkaliphilus]|uniref:Uncharacterized protein n=1 Tax=Algoriphagus alkaliphilus TaxID=279824 RepID=A0A1G5VFD9_9BACT|nr:hypothetical protein SAMN03080617_00503 [Algoriphagus alkaliphilus]